MSQIFTHCPKCQSPFFVKAGFNNGKQRHKCKDCCYYFSVRKHNSHKSDDIKKMAIDMYLEGLGFVCGKQDSKTFERLYNHLNPNNIKLFCSDYWKSYQEIIPTHKHLTSKAQTFTIEGYNSLIRHFTARFKRKTKCYSKCQKMTENTLSLLFAKWNGGLRCVF